MKVLGKGIAVGSRLSWRRLPARWLVLLLLFMAGGGWPALHAAHAQGLQPVPALSSQVVDAAGLLKASERQRIEARLAALERDKGVQVAFLLVATTAPEDIASYANRVGNAWKIGRRGVGDGVLLVVARDDRAVRIEVAKTLEGALPDLAARMIIDDALTPAFRRGDYAQGLLAAAEQIAARVRGEPLPPPPRRDRGEGFRPMDFALFLFVAVPLAASVLRGIFGRRWGSALTGAGVGMLALWASSSLLIAGVAAFVGAILSLMGLVPMGRPLGGHGPWRVPHHTGRWGGGWSGSGGGGFRSGGGGDFGGGGASGRW